MTTTYKQLLDRVISDGVAEVSEAYKDPEDHHKRDGAIEGFEVCRDKTPAEIVVLWQAAEREAMGNMQGDDSPNRLKAYWKQRYKALQLEFVLNVLSAGLPQPLLAHLPTYCGVAKYAEIVGVTQ